METPPTDLALVERDGPIATLTLNRPEKRNAIDLAMVDALHGALDRLADERDLSCLVLTGAGGKAFAAGADIAQLRDRGVHEALMGINSRLFHKVERFPVPVIAAVQGWALGGGCELALACDLRVAGESAKFGQPEVSLGIIPGAGATQRLPRLVGLGAAKELIYTGRIIDAAEALRIGLVNRVVPDDQVLESARSLAQEIVKNGPLALRLAKVALDASHRTGSDTGLLIETLAQASCFESEDKYKRMTAFLEKRK
ncbi:MAG TPA: enoyl-CoA hydratase-related protein [bacterium]|nr:enoyl-CoA hydratase-related protein [bacterium]